jgi:hypothetical protein
MGRSQYVELHYSKQLLALTEEPTNQKAVQTIQSLVPNLKELGYYLSDKKYDGITFMPKEENIFYLRVEDNIPQAAGNLRFSIISNSSGLLSAPGLGFMYYLEPTTFKVKANFNRSSFNRDYLDGDSLSDEFFKGLAVLAGNLYRSHGLCLTFSLLDSSRREIGLGVKPYKWIENNVSIPEIKRTIAPGHIFSPSPELESVFKALRDIPLYYGNRGISLIYFCGDKQNCELILSRGSSDYLDEYMRLPFISNGKFVRSNGISQGLTSIFDIPEAQDYLAKGDYLLVQSVNLHFSIKTMSAADMQRMDRKTSHLSASYR